MEDMKAGEVITEKNMGNIRLDLGLSPKYYDVVMGKTVKYDLKMGTVMKLDMIKDGEK